MKQKLPPELVQQRMRRMLTRNRAYRRDMVVARRSGIFYFAEMLMEARLIIDHLGGKKSNAKRLVMEVAPDWLGETSAHRILRVMKKDGYVTVETDPDDHRFLIVQPTEKMLERCERRWMRVDDEYPPAPSRLTPAEVAKRSRGAYGIGTLANWRSLDIGPDFIRIEGEILYPLDRLEKWESMPAAPPST
jgi:hypothetical protein